MGGNRVEVHGLKRKEFNGLVGVVRRGPLTNGRYLVHLTASNKRVKLKPENMKALDNEEDDDVVVDDEENDASSSITPELVKRVQRILMRPGGIRDFLRHPEVVSLRARDQEMGKFFQDIESGGLMGALPY